jgi:uncharacterized pyridoxamine 5'-phosphate oxidase family protein
MLIWILITIILIITIFFVIKSIISKNIDSNSINTTASSFPDNQEQSPIIRKLKAVDVLPNVKTIKEKKEFNWLKLHQNINPVDNSEIQTKLIKLIREEREYIIIDKFIYFTEQNPNHEILQVLEEIEKNTLSYQEILRRLGNR